MKQFFATLFAMAAAWGCTKPSVPDTSGTSTESAEERAIVEFAPTAAQELQKRMKDLPVSTVRVAVTREGPTGFMYNMAFDDEVDPQRDFVSSSRGIRVIVDKASATLLEGSVIDWRTTPDGQTGFHFDNPNADE